MNAKVVIIMTTLLAAWLGPHLVAALLPAVAVAAWLGAHLLPVASAVILAALAVVAVEVARIIARDGWRITPGMAVR